VVEVVIRAVAAVVIQVVAEATLRADRMEAKILRATEIELNRQTTSPFSIKCSIN
jgi:hypothetical protein